MRIRDLMSTPVVAVDEETSVHGAMRIMEAHKIKRLPVMRKGKLVGLLTERMLAKADSASAGHPVTPQTDSSLLKMPVKEVMVKDPYTLSPDMPPEEVLVIGQVTGYSGFPVVENGLIVGMVTESDIVRIMTKALGVRGGSKRVDLKISREFGTLQRIIEILDEKRVVLLSLMTFLRPEDNDYMIILRIQAEDTGPIVKDLTEAGLSVTYVGKNVGMVIHD
jgi:acetoin utilization protein AcuB